MRGKVANPELNLHTRVIVDRQRCGYCGACVAICQENAIFLLDAYLHIDAELCTACERCVRVCPLHALSAVTPDIVPVGEAV